ncbi:GNAT family N-acetyltransferase [Bifidobacterium goeldii]|uniref:GNAT family N-acetyltransferase n=1 Tax=Bifidobacterium goeldii TaxID=2306975 RepID=UPI000F7D9708|nr:GNAT family protein [Bifidobacterium goeldii]
MSVFQSLRAALTSSSANAIRVPRRIAMPECPLALRPITPDDEEEWNEVRWRNDDWLRPWESGDPMHGPGLSYNQWMQRQRRNEQEGRGVVFVMEHRSRIVGQISLGAINLGSMRTGIIGYWVDQCQAGHGFAPMAVCLLADWAMLDPNGLHLHRLEIALLPENERSRSVALKVGARYEGIRHRYMFVNGRWRDHETYSLLAEDADGGFTRRFMARHAMP